MHMTGIKNFLFEERSNFFEKNYFSTKSSIDLDSCFAYISFITRSSKLAFEENGHKVKLF